VGSHEPAHHAPRAGGAAADRRHHARLELPPAPEAAQRGVPHGREPRHRVTQLAGTASLQARRRAPDDPLSITSCVVLHTFSNASRARCTRILSRNTFALTTAISRSSTPPRFQHERLALVGDSPRASFHQEKLSARSSPLVSAGPPRRRVVEHVRDGSAHDDSCTGSSRCDTATCGAARSRQLAST